MEKDKINDYICSECGKEEIVDHVNPLVKPYLCLDCIIKQVEENIIEIRNRRRK